MTGFPRTGVSCAAQEITLDQFEAAPPLPEILAHPGLRCAYEALLAGLDADQAREVAQPWGSVLATTANAGSGKTHFLVARALRWVMEGGDARRMVLFSFTNDSSAKLHERFWAIFREHLPADHVAAMPRPSVGTIHRFGFGLLARSFQLTRSPLPEGRAARLLHDTFAALDLDEGEYRRLPKGIEAINAAGEMHAFVLPEFDEAGQFVRAHDMTRLDPFDPSPSAAALLPVLHRLHRLSGGAAERRLSGRPVALTPEWLADTRGHYARIAGASPHTIAKVLAAYATAKGRAGVVDLADFLREPVLLMVQHERFRRRARDRYAQYFADEMQDMTPAELALVTYAAGVGGPDPEPDDPARPQRGLTGVADSKQQLYGWRGAMPKAADDLAGYLGLPPSAVNAGTLRFNYRSVPSLVALANKFAERFHRRVLFPSVATRAVQARAVRVKTFADTDAEDAWLSQELRALRAEGVPWSASTVIARTNKDLDLIRGAMIAAAVPFRMRRDTREAIASEPFMFLQALLSLALNPRDATALGVVAGAVKGIGDVGRAALSVHLQDALADPAAGAVEALRRLPDARAEALRHMLGAVLPPLGAALAAGPFPDAAAALRTALLAEATWPDLSGKTDLGRAMTIEWSAVQRALAHATTLHATLAGEPEFRALSFRGQGAEIQAAMAMAREAEDASPRDDRVSLSTAHGMKALENQNIFLAHLNGTRPAPRDPEENDAERCVFYVCATRARDRFYCTASERVRNHRGIWQKAVPNPYLAQYMRGMRELMAQPP